MAATSEAPQQQKSRRVPFTTILILVLAGIAGVTYYLGTPAISPSLTPSTSCPGAVQIVVGSSSSSNYESPSLTVVVGINNTIAWIDNESGFELHVISTAVPQAGGQWELNMTQGQTDCLTLTAAGTYSYYYLGIPGPSRTLIVKEADST